MKETGFVYVAYGEKFILEAIRSAQTLRSYIADADITLFTTKGENIPDPSIFSQIIEKDMEMSYIDKPRCLRETPYKRTLYLDSDTYFCDNIVPLFGLLDYFDIGMIIEPCQPKVVNFDTNKSIFKSEHWDTNLIYLSEYNTGVILFRMNEATKCLLTEWETIYRQRKHLDAHDQPSMSLALAKTSVRFVTLPFEFNFRFGGPLLLYNNVKILHGRVTRSFKKLESKLNAPGSRGRLRCWAQAYNRCFYEEGHGLRKWFLTFRKLIAPYFQPVRSRLKLHGDILMPKKQRFEK